MSLLPHNASPTERAVDAAAAAALSLPTPIADLWNPDTCPASALPWLAWALHVENWDAATTEAQQREAIKLSVLLHRKKGTPWAIKRALAAIGLEVEIFDRQDQRRIYAEHSPNRLDGTWQLDGSRQVMPLALVTGIPHINHWAQFIVRLNLAEANDPKVLAQLRELIDQWKPQRSWPIFAYWIRFFVTITIGVRSRFALQKRVLVPIWPGLYVSDRRELKWQIGTDGAPLKLDGSWQVGAGMQIGAKYGAIAGPALRSFRVRSAAALTMRTAVDTRPRQRLVPLRTIMTPTPTVLQRLPRKLDGTWTVGTLTRLDGTWKLDGSRKIAPHSLTTAPKLGEFQVRPPSRAIPDPSQSGRLRLDGSWQVGGAAQPESRTLITRI